MFVLSMSVVRFESRPYSREHFYAPAVFVGTYDGNELPRWYLSAFLGPVFTREIQAIGHAYQYGEKNKIPYCFHAEEGERIDFNAYRAACEEVGIKCEVPESTAPAGDGANGTGVAS